MIIYLYKNNIFGENMKIIDTTIKPTKFEIAVDKIFSALMTGLIIGIVLLSADMTTYDKTEADRIIAQSK